MGRYIYTIETWLFHRTSHFERTVFQYHTLLDVLIHLRTSGVVNVHIVEQRTRFQHTHRKRRLLTRFVSPVLMIWLNQHLNTVSAYLRQQRQQGHKTKHKYK